MTTLETPMEPATLRGLEESMVEGLHRVAGRENRFTIAGVSWEQYLEMDRRFCDDGTGPRLYWYDEQLEVLGTSLKHEELRVWIAALIQDLFFALGITDYPHGQATLRMLRTAGAEPDESWCLDTQKEFPDIVLEIALTSGGLPKLEIYKSFGVLEVWFWRRNQLEIWALHPDHSRYEGPAKQSVLVPKLDVHFLERCIEFPTLIRARRAFRESLP